MTDSTKGTAGKPEFDTDAAWERFEKLAARESAPLFWSRGEQTTLTDTMDTNIGKTGEDNQQTKDGVVAMTESGIGMKASTDTVDGSWRTERPAKRRLRRWAAGTAAAVAAVCLFATPLGDRALAALQQTFRIQHIVGVSVSADDLTTISSLLERGSPEGDKSFSLAQYGTISQSGGGKNSTVTWDEAEQRMGAALIRPVDASAPVYQPATTLIFDLNVEAVNRLLTRLGGSKTLPAEADGKSIRLQIPDGIETTGTLNGKQVHLLQFGKPELTVEDGINPAAVREAVLGLPVLPESLRTKLAAIGDWQNTLPVPAPDGVTTNLRLGGYDAVMTVKGKNRQLFWLDGNKMGLLAGAVKDFPSEAAFQRAAEELILP